VIASPPMQNIQHGAAGMHIKLQSCSQHFPSDLSLFASSSLANRCFFSVLVQCIRN
jgi:hypothetical protein